MEELNILEQPQVNELNSHNEVMEIKEGESENLDACGSNILNKFKSVEALNSAYNNLQAEFTKKCQRLSELEKYVNKTEVPRYKLENWAEELSNFFDNNPKAKEYSKEIAKQILEDESLAKKSDCLTLAWANILSKKNLNETDLVNDENFLENYIYNNQKIKDEIIKKYIQEKEKAPFVMTNTKGASLNIAPKQKPSTIDEAKNIVKELFK